MLEHANLQTTDIKETLRFLSLSVPEWQVRGGGTTTAPGGGVKRWVHVGIDTHYLALQDFGEGTASLSHFCSHFSGGGIGVVKSPTYSQVGINHIGIVVTEELAVIRSRLLTNGYKENEFTSGEDGVARERMYFYDGNGIEYEFIRYKTEDFAARNNYGEYQTVDFL